MDLVVVFVLALGLGMVLGYLSALPRVRHLEKELVNEWALDWRRDSRLAQELSLQRLQQEQRTRE